MQLDKFESVIFVMLFIVLGVFSKDSSSKLKKILTKQSVKNIRFISFDGTFTYYQKYPGVLVFSKYYNLHEVLKGPLGTNYRLFSSQSRKKILITKDPLFFNSNQQNRLKFIYWADYGEKKAVFLSKGLFPKLHLDDSWVSFYDPNLKKIIFKSLVRKVGFSIKLQNPINPYFIPEVLMTDEKTILFTDLNEKGESAILVFNRSLGKMLVLLKSKMPGVKIELCLQGSLLFVSQFSHLGNSYGSEISYLDIQKSKNLKKLVVLYKSSRGDPGNVECNTVSKNIYFIQNQSEYSLSYYKKVEAVMLDIKRKKVITVSDFNYVTRLINLDGRILVPFRGDFYLVEGKGLDEDSFSKKKNN